MPVTFLHISDIHLKGGDRYDQEVVLRALVESVGRFYDEGRRPDLVFMTGDIAYAGKPDQYALAADFFDDLLAAAHLDRSRLFVVPGNHDVDRDLAIDLVRTLDSREHAATFFNPALPKNHITQKQGAFVAWHDAYFTGVRTWPRTTTAGPLQHLKIGGESVAVLCLNSALFCLDDHDHDELFLGRRCLEGPLEELKAFPNALKIGVVHHPLDWLSHIERDNIETALHESLDMLLHGHLHSTRAHAETYSGGAGLLHLAAGAAYQTRQYSNAAHYGTVRGDGDLNLFPIRYEDAPKEIWTLDPSRFPTEPGNEGHLSVRRVAPQPESPGVLPRPARSTVRSTIASRGNLPFVGRDTLLRQIAADLADSGTERVVVLHGHPGVGKSELAREYGRNYGSRYPGGTYFVPWGGGNELVILSEIGSGLLGIGFSEQESLDDRALKTIRALTAEPHLLIFDNPPRPDGMDEKWIPVSGAPCHILITCVEEPRESRWVTHYVPPLGAESCLEIVTEIGGPAVATQLGGGLVTMADGLPMQLVPASRAAAYEARHGRLESATLALADQTLSSFAFPYDILERESRLVLHAAVLQSRDRVVVEELRLALALADPGGFDVALDACRDFHLLEGQDELRMHQLLAAFLVGIEADPSAGAGFNTEIEKARGRQHDRFVSLARSVAASPNDRSTAANLLSYQVGPEAWRQAAVPLSVEDGETVGRALYEIGQFAEARPWFERAVTAAEQGDIHGRIDHESLGKSLHAVGSCLISLGQFAEARPWFERAVTAAEQGDIHGRIDHASLERSRRALRDLPG